MRIFRANYRNKDKNNLSFIFYYRDFNSDTKSNACPGAQVYASAEVERGSRWYESERPTDLLHVASRIATLDAQQHDSLVP